MINSLVKRRSGGVSQVIGVKERFKIRNKKFYITHIVLVEKDSTNSSLRSVIYQKMFNE